MSKALVCLLAAAIVTVPLFGCNAPPSRLRVARMAQQPPRVAHRVDPIPVPEPLFSPLGARTVDEIVEHFGPYVDAQLKPYFARAGVPYPPRDVTFIALKEERRFEIWARDGGAFRHIRDYDVRAASGVSGPKLKQGDRQVPEGIYSISSLNPNSQYHLSMRIDYPNAFDLARAEDEGRTDPGGDIFIHGDQVSAGCLAMGDEAIEDLFVLAARVGRENIKVIIAPHDARINPLRADDPRLPTWTADLYDMIHGELLAYSATPRPGMARAPGAANSFR